MPTAKRNVSSTWPGYAFNAQEPAVSFDNFVAYEVPMPALVAAQTGTLSTRTDDNTGIGTLSTGHGIVSAMVVDVYWSGGVRYGMAATVTVNAIALEGGAGDVLPIATTAITIVEQVEINPLNLDGDNAEMVGVYYRNASDQSAKAHLDLQDSGSATIEELDLVHETAAGGLNHITNIAGGDTNIYTGNPITKGFASHDSTSAGILYVLIGIDATP